MTSCSRVAFDVNKETGWPKFHTALARVGCKEDDIKFIWSKVKSEEHGEIDVSTRMPPSQSVMDIHDALSLFASRGQGLKSGDIVVAWEHTGLMKPGMVSARIFS
jgi:hypothetical protein